MIESRGRMVKGGGSSSIAPRSRDRRRARALPPSKRDKPEQMGGGEPRKYKVGLRTRNHGSEDMQAPEIFVGIDVSKAQLDVHIRPTDARLSFVNDEAGAAQLAREL